MLDGFWLILCFFVFLKFSECSSSSLIFECFYPDDLYWIFTVINFVIFHLFLRGTLLSLYCIFKLKSLAVILPCITTAKEADV